MRDIIIFLDMDTTGSTPQFMEAARSLGLRPIMLSTTPWLYRDVPAANAVRMRVMTIGSVAAEIDRLGVDNVAGIFTPRSAHAELAARVAQAIGRPHSDPEAIAICHNKLETRRFLERKGFTDVAYQNIMNAEEAYTFAKNMGGNSVLKPHTSSGAAGVRVCSTPEDTRKYADKLFRENPSGIMIEEFIQGPFYGIETCHGKAFSIRRQFISDPPHPIIIGQEAPAREPADIHRSLAAHAAEVLKLIGYTRGLAQVQSVYANNRPYLIEINPRVPAGLAPMNIKAGYGIDVAQLCLKFACGLPDLIDTCDTQNPKRYAVTSHLLKINKPIRAIRGIEDASRVPHVVEVGVLPVLFGRHGPVSSLSDRVAYVQSVAESPEVATDSAIAGLSKLTQVPMGSMGFWLRKRRDKLMRRINYRKAN